jgi:PAS domain S-box-containing protein
MHDDFGQLEQRWGLALQSAGFGIWDLDLVSDRVHYSPEWKAMLGYDGPDEPEGTGVWRGRVHPDDLQPMVTAIVDHLDGHSVSYEQEFRLRAADGRYRWVLSRGRVVARCAEGRALRMVGTLTDLTDRREAEALRIAFDRAEAASRAKTAFLSRMSHELRTPLNAVLGFAQLLQAKIGSADVGQQRGYAKSIEQAGWHLLTLIDTVLELSRAQSGQLHLQIEPVLLGPLLQEAVDAAARKAREQAKAQNRERAVELRLGEVPATAAVLADPVRLAQVLATLLGNAIKFNREGGSVTLEADATPDGWRLCVIDTGIGIAAERMPQIFEPFDPLGPSAPGTDGVGFGLMLARWLVESMGGRLSVHSTPGIGSTFEVSLPGHSAGAGDPGLSVR